ncbi:MAG: hypothetical protein ACI8PZ_003503 [Myxococcota bacterium]|jgi:hypothetical protein
MFRAHALATVFGLSMFVGPDASLGDGPVRRTIPEGTTARDCRVDVELAPLAEVLDGDGNLMTNLRADPESVARLPNAGALFADSAADRARMVAATECTGVGTLGKGVFAAYWLGVVHAAEGWQHLNRGEARAAESHARETAAVGRALSGTHVVGAMVGSALEAHALDLLEASIEDLRLGERAAVARSWLRRPDRVSIPALLYNEAAGQEALLAEACSSPSSVKLCLKARGWFPWRPMFDPAGVRALAAALTQRPARPGEALPARTDAVGVTRTVVDLVVEQAEIDRRLDAALWPLLPTRLF